MRKWITPLLIAVLFVSVAGNGFLYLRQNTIIGKDEVLIASLKTAVAGVGNEISSLSEAFQTLSGTIPGLSDSIGTLKTDVGNAADGVTSLNGTILTMAEDVSRLTGLVTSMQQAQDSGGPGVVVNFTRATESVKPSVVVIETETVVTVFPGRRVIQRAAGSGWVINRDGLIVTNDHVVADATNIKVTLADGRTFTSTAVRTNAATDLAVVKIDAHDLPAAKIGDSSKLKVGQPVAAIGNALGLGINMTGGWVSRLNTSIAFSDGSRLSGLIGTDTAINPGNSGGPLVNLDGEVIGITNAKLVESGVESIGYAISINNAMETINSLIATL